MIAVLHLKLMVAETMPPDQRARSLAEGMLRIGRDLDNDWVLEDEARLVSRHHCTISAKAGLFTIIDTSANGVFINDAERALGRGNSAILSDGDLLHLGDLTIVATVETRTDEADAFRALLPPLEQGLPAAPEWASGAPAPQPSPVAAQSSAVPRAAVALPARTTRPPPRLDWPTPREPFGDLPARSTPSGPATPPNHLPVEEEALLPPRVRLAQIPDDWDMDADDQPAPQPSPEMSQPALAPSATAADADRHHGLLLSLIEALGVIERAAPQAGTPRLFAGTPEEALQRLIREDEAWMNLSLLSLSARIAARLGQPVSPSPLHSAPDAGDDRP